MLNVLDSSPMISYAVDEHLCIQYCNPAWDRFAIENAARDLAGGAAIGTDLHCVIADDLKPFYMQGFHLAVQSGRVWECFYECSSPQLFRKFQMRIHPLRPPGWSLVTNTLVIEHPHTEVRLAGLEAYVDQQSQIVMCCHCRKSRTATTPEQWDFVPAHLEPNLSNISHGLCPICLEYFHPKPNYDSDTACSSTCGDRL
jgi:hypothetical protein